MVDWCYLGARPLVEPFFDQTITSCLQHPFNLFFRHQTSIDQLIDRYHEQPGLNPTGFIFHMSRSGSTLISRMFAALPQNIVISEARPVDGVLQARINSPAVSQEQYIDWVRAMVSALGQPRRGSEKHFFIKFEAWHVLMLPIIRKAFPNVPWIFSYRDPVEVLVSQQENTGQVIPNFLHYSLFGSKANVVASLPADEYRALVLAALCRAALKHHQDGGLLLNYKELPVAVGSAISGLFRVEWTDEEITTMNGITRHHSKEQGIFKSDSEKKQQKATSALRQAADKWLYPIYQELERARLGTE